MATRKQRRRREKSFRHEYGFVVEDEEGNEVELDRSELRAQKAAPEKGNAKGKPDATPPEDDLLDGWRVGRVALSFCSGARIPPSAPVSLPGIAYDRSRLRVVTRT